MLRTDFSTGRDVRVRQYIRGTSQSSLHLKPVMASSMLSMSNLLTTIMF